MPSIFDLHVHTSKGSPDSGLSAEEMVEEGLRIGLTGAMATAVSYTHLTLPTTPYV